MMMAMMNPRRVCATLALAVWFGCGWLTPRPDVIAERFWDATVDGDFERASEYVTASSVDLLERHADAVPELESVTIGDVNVTDDDARVQTRLVAMVNDRATEVDFETVLEQEDGQWRVDLRETTGQLVARLVGAAAGDFVGQIGEMVGGQVRGMFDDLLRGLAAGMDEGGRSRQGDDSDSTGGR